jgi:hypothetical protein
MRRVEFIGYIIIDEEELLYGSDIVGQMSDHLFNVDGVHEWDFHEVSNNEIEYEVED